MSRNRKIDQILWILQRILSFYSFWTLLNTVSVQKHFWIRLVSRNRRCDQILWILQGILSFYSFWTLLNTVSVQKQEILTKFFEYFKGFCRFPVSRHFWIRKVSINMRNNQILWTQKSQETWKRPNSLCTECVWKQEQRPIPLSMECGYKHEKRPNLLNK